MIDEHELRALVMNVRRGRLSRRAFTRLLAMLGITGSAAAHLLGAAGHANAQGPRAHAPSRRGGGGELRLIYWQAPVILNPHLALGVKDRDAARIFYEPLAAYDQAGGLVPVLAAEIPSVEGGGVARDGLSVTWRLKREEIRIHVILQSARLGIAYGLIGRHREAIHLLEDASAAEESTRFLTNRAKTLTALGYEYLAVRDTGRARDAADRALQFTRERSARGDEADALARLGEICLAEAPESLDLAETTLMRSPTIAQEIGMKPLMARLQLCLAHLEIARKNNDAAGRRLSEAAQMCRDLGLQRWLRESEQLAFRLRP
jgi:tetratricopeptide (TPR) repeat protein